MAFVLEVTWEGCMYMMVMSGGRSSFDVDYTFKTVRSKFSWEAYIMVTQAALAVIS